MLLLAVKIFMGVVIAMAGVGFSNWLFVERRRYILAALVMSLLITAAICLGLYMGFVVTGLVFCLL